MSVSAWAQMRITEYMYSGTNGEFIEFTNIGAAPIDMTGWSYSDSARIPGNVDLSAYGVVNPGESVILTDAAALTFAADWSLAGSVDVIGGLIVNLGRNDEINLYDNTSALADRLTYGDQDFPGTIRTQNRSGWPCAEGVGLNDIFQWNLATAGDAKNSYFSTGNDQGNPGIYGSVSCGPPPSGACCTLGACTEVSEDDCLMNGGTFQGEGTDCGSTVCPVPTTGAIRITEYMYSGEGGEFVEFTNLDTNPIDMTGWSYDDDSQAPGTVSLSAFGVVQPGESVILAEDSAAVFNAAWNLSGVDVIGSNTTNLGRNDEINLFDSFSNLVDRLTYGDQNFPGTIRAQFISGWPCEPAIGANDIFGWRLSAIGDAQSTFASTNDDLGNPGFFVVHVCTGACCNAGGCVNGLTQADCTASGGTYAGHDTVCEGDADGDGIDGTCGDACPNDPDNDKDGDGQCGEVDPCPNDPDNDKDGDGICGNVDACPNDADNDKDGDGICGNVDACPNDPDNDKDGDGLCGNVDPCPNDADNDKDGDGICGNVDACPNDADNDKDGDGICGNVDTCPNDPDNDKDGDGICGNVDACPNDADNDKDNDGLCGDADPFPNDPDNDKDADGVGADSDPCPNDADNDKDGDGVCGDIDNCPNTPNPGQEDSDGNGTGDACTTIPTVSEWGLVIMALLLLSAWKASFGRFRRLSSST